MDLPIGAMTAIPPALRYRVLDLMGRNAAGEELTRHVAALLEHATPWLGADPALVEVGLWLTAPTHAPALRALGCAWLAHFPTVDTVERLAGLAAEPPLYDAAIRALADRQLRAKHPSTRWSSAAVQLADDALFRLADAAATSGRASPVLMHALRHVHSEGIAAVFARTPSLWGPALEVAATAPLARVLFVSIDDIQPVHRLRVLRLIAVTLGDDAVPLLTARAGARTATLDEQIESLLLAIAFGGEPQLARFEDAVRAIAPAQAAQLRTRARWHLAHRGVVPSVRGLRVARSTATLAPDERAAACGRAADDLGALVHAARHPEPETYELWAWLVRGAGDPARARALWGAHPAALPIVRDLVIDELARRGKVEDAIRVAQEAPDRGALALAIWGRPVAALELAAIARHHTPELACARILACHRAGRPDLAARLLVEDPPPREPADDETAGFPGFHERWLAEHAPAERPAITALVGGQAAILALAHAADPDAEPDHASLQPLLALDRRLDRTLRGKQVCVCEARPTERAAIAAILERAGARVVTAPLPATDFYVAGAEAIGELISELERMGTRRLRPEELG